jgi:diguanylate cyclase (GGDEF)-like protein
MNLDLDLRTVMLMTAGVNLLFAGILMLVGRHAGAIKGARQWALGDLCIGLSFGAAGPLPEPPVTWVIVLLAMMVGAGIGLLYSGIEAFKGKRCNYTVPVALAALMAMQNIWFTVLHDDVQGRIAANWLVYSLVHAACAWNLFVRIEKPMRTAYWLAAASFAFVALATGARAADAVLSAVSEVRLFEANTASQSAFFVASMAQISLSFALVLLINYRLANDLRRLAAIDALTGLLNRGSLEGEAARLAARASRSGGNIALILIDVDNFKGVNDRYGHPAGDEVLRQLAALMTVMTRSGDCLGRYGGEEFCMVLPDTSEADAAVLAERLRQRYANLRVAWRGEMLSGSISIGVADARLAGVDMAAMVAAADKALYQAKGDGRNRVVLYSACMVAPELERLVASSHLLAE